VAGVCRSHVLALGGQSAVRHDARGCSPRRTAAGTFGYIERSTLSARFRLNYALTPNFTIEGYAEPFAASGRYFDFGELRHRGAARAADLARADGHHDLEGRQRRVDRDGRRDNLHDSAAGLQSSVVPVNLVLRWEWLPGSTAF
jgi:hypothetical protein